MSGEEAPLAEQMDCDPAPNAQHIEGGKQNVNQEPKLYINKITDKNVLVKIFGMLIEVNSIYLLTAIRGYNID